MLNVLCVLKQSGVQTWFAQSCVGRLLLGLTVAFVVSAQPGCSSALVPMDFPIAAGSAADIHLPGRIVWNDLLTSDVSAAREFYGQLFDWSFDGNERYTIITHDGRRIGGIIHVVSPSGEPRTPRWLMTMSVPDVDEASAFVLTSGGKVHEGPGNLKGRGRASLVSDPHGAQLALLRAEAGDPVDMPAQSGTWLWHELWTDDPEDSIEFYTALAGYSGTEDLDDYYILKTGNEWRAGVRAVFDRNLEQRWVPVIRVDDADATAAQATHLGGRVVVTAQPDATVLLSDPGGALFIVQEWEGKSQLPLPDES